MVAPQKNQKPPCKVVVIGAEGQDPAAVVALNKRLAGTISRFYNTSRQNSDNSLGDVWYARKALPERQGMLEYSSNQGMEIMTIRLNPKEIEGFSEPVEPPKENPWDWVIVEIVVEGLSPDGGADMATELTASAVCENMEAHASFTYPVSTQEGDDPQQDNTDSDPVLKFSETAVFDQEDTIASPAPGTAVASLIVDLRRFGKEDVKVDLSAGLRGGAHLDVVGHNRNVPGGFNPLVSTSAELLGDIDFDAAYHMSGFTKVYDSLVAVHTSAADLWPVLAGPHYYDLTALSLDPHLTGYGPFTQASGTLAGTDGTDLGQRPADALWYDHSFESFVADEPIPFPNDFGGSLRTYSGGGVLASGDPVDAGGERFYGEVLEQWPATGLVKRYEAHFPTATAFGGATVTSLGAGTDNIKQPYGRAIWTYAYPDAVPVSDSVPAHVELPAKMRWGAGFGPPPDDKITALAGYVTYSEWVMAIAPLRYAKVKELDDEFPINNDAEIDLGQLRINRFLHAFALKS